MPRLPTQGKWVRNKAPDRGKIRGNVIKVRLSDEELAMLKRAAELDGIAGSRIMRSEGMQGVIRRLKRAGVPSETATGP